MSRHARNKDLNHAEVVAAFRALGCDVTTMESGRAGVPDLLVGVAGVDQQVEVKDGRKVPSARRLSPAQVEYAATWRGRRVALVECAEDCVGVVNAMRVVMTPDLGVDPSDWERP